MAWLNEVSRLLWQPLFLLLIGVGIFFTVTLRGIQFTKLAFAFKLLLTARDQDAKGDISHFQAFTTSLAGIIGIANVAGVATAITVGGVGALFWLWVIILIGMATKFAEGVLAITYRTRDESGSMSGGPMHYISRGLGWKKLAAFFAFFGIVATLFSGNLVQAHSIVTALETSFGIQNWAAGCILAVCVGAVLFGGIRRIGWFTAFLVPAMALLYICGGLVVILFSITFLPQALLLILKSAFTGQAAVGGFAGSTILMAIQMGVARGVFSSESGLGTAPIAAASAKTEEACTQALIAMTGAFLSALICTITGLTIALTFVLGGVDAHGLLESGVPLTIRAFNTALPGSGIIVVFGCLLFGYSTIVGWAYYGEKCSEYLFGTRAIFVYRLIFTLSIFWGGKLPLDVAWALADISNACMAFPNIIGVFALHRVVRAQAKQFFQKPSVGVAS